MICGVINAEVRLLILDCAKDCARCTNSYTCTQCVSSQMFPVGGVCSFCPNGKYLNPSTQSCEGKFS